MRDAPGAVFVGVVWQRVKDQIEHRQQLLPALLMNVDGLQVVQHDGEEIRTHIFPEIGPYK